MASFAKPQSIVPLFVPTKPSAADATTPSVSYHGGPVIGAVRVTPVFWGGFWSQPQGIQLVARLEQFFDAILVSSLMDLLQEYSTPSTTIGHGTRLASVTIATEPGTVVGGIQTVSDAQIQQALAGWAAAGTIPPAGANNLYFVYLPPGVVVTMTGQTSCVDFCGYHGTAGGGLFYAVEPYVTCSGCASGSTLDALTRVTSHELAEAVTDPALDAWWDSATGYEIGDICNTSLAQVGGFVVQNVWSNRQSACALAPLV
jgi:hypothetical protein